MIKDSETKIIRVEQLGTFKDLSDSLIAKLSMVISLATTVSTISTASNAEWKVVYCDKEGKVLFGIQADGTWVLCKDIDEIMDFIVSQYTTT